MSSPSDFFDVIEFDYELEKKKFVDNMNFLKNMDVTEQTFYKKWYELQGYKHLVANSAITKSKIWVPNDIQDESETVKQLESMNPTIEVVNKTTENDWLMLRVFCHTMEFSQTPGRFLKLIIHDGTSERRLLGGISISSDVIAITDRDNYIGWTSDDRLKGEKRINNSAIGSCIMSTQPFGYNFLGGKLAACLVTTDVVRDVWKRDYNNIMAGMTTTSLYGSFSMYNSLKWWHKCGTSAGKMSIKPDDSVYEVWHHWLQDNKPQEYEEMMRQKDGISGPVTGAKQRVIAKIFSQLNLKTSDYVHGFERGTYYSSFYENTKDFLCNRIKESELVMKPLYAGGKSVILDWWRPRAIERYKKLRSESHLKSDILYYNDMIGMEYKEAKDKYLNEVGR